MPKINMGKEISDTVFGYYIIRLIVLCLSAFGILFAKEPDLIDAIIHYLMRG